MLSPCLLLYNPFSCFIKADLPRALAVTPEVMGFKLRFSDCAVTLKIYFVSPQDKKGWTLETFTMDLSVVKVLKSQKMVFLHGCKLTRWGPILQDKSIRFSGPIQSRPFTFYGRFLPIPYFPQVKGSLQSLISTSTWPAGFMMSWMCIQHVLIRWNTLNQLCRDVESRSLRKSKWPKFSSN